MAGARVSEMSCGSIVTDNALRVADSLSLVGQNVFYDHSHLVLGHQGRLQAKENANQVF